jgi:hypothetical protein
MRSSVAYPCSEGQQRYGDSGNTHGASANDIRVDLALDVAGVVAAGDDHTRLAADVQLGKVRVLTTRNQAPDSSP